MMVDTAVQVEAGLVCSFLMEMACVVRDRVGCRQCTRGWPISTRVTATTVRVSECNATLSHVFVDPAPLRPRRTPPTADPNGP